MYANQYPSNQAPLQQIMTQCQSQSIYQHQQQAPQSFQNFVNQPQISQMDQNQNTQNFAANQMVMIDQNELLELLQIKQQLITHKMAAQTAAPQQVKPLYEGQGFQSALFVTPPKSELKQNLNTSNTNSTSDRSSDSGINSQISEPKTKSQIIEAPKHTSLFSMDFLDDESIDEPVVQQLTARSTEQKQEEDLMKIIGDSSIDLSQDMPSSISSNHESGNQSFEEQTQAAQEFFPQAVSQALYFPPLQQVQQNLQQPSIAEVNELAQVTRIAGGVKPLHQTFTPTFTAFQPSQLVCEQPTQSMIEKANEFKFPDGGWECGKCQNYNFKGRKECHRCKKAKGDDDCEGMPQHLTMSPNQRADAKKKGLLKNKKITATVETIVECEEKQCYTPKVAAAATHTKKIQERVGDWTCQRCFNHNFAFRDVCNMCYMSHIESNKLLYGQQNQRFEQIQNLNQFVPQQPYQQFNMQMPAMQQPTMSCNAPAWTPKFSNY